jgi:hypothetical protein
VGRFPIDDGLRMPCCFIVAPLHAGSHDAVTRVAVVLPALGLVRTVAVWAVGIDMLQLEVLGVGSMALRFFSGDRVGIACATSADVARFPCILPIF